MNNAWYKLYMVSRKHTCKGHTSRGLNHAVTYRQLGLADSDNTSKRLIRCCEHGLCTYVINCSYYTPLFQINNSGVIKQGCWMYFAALGLACWEWEWWGSQFFNSLMAYLIVSNRHHIYSRISQVQLEKRT